MKCLSAIAGLGVLLAAAPFAWSQAKLPEGPGLAARYPGDKGIERDASVLFTENFEAGSIADVGRRWTNSKNDKGQPLGFSDQVAPASSGKRCLQVTADLQANTGGDLYKKLPRGVDTAYARFYVKFADDADYIHHFVTLGGYNPPTNWAQGGAGEKPRGNDRVTVGIEPWGDWGRQAPPGMWNFYAYWFEMDKSRDGKYWGNSFRPAEPRLPPRGKWQCVELMLKLNSDPGKSDGELALWLDGKLAAHFYKGARVSHNAGAFTLVKTGGEVFPGFRWRKSKDLQVNFFWLMHYVTENAGKQNNVKKPHRFNRVWFDDVVVATQYVGPIKK